MIRGVLRCLALLSVRARRRWAGLVCLGVGAAALEALGVVCVLGLIRTLRASAVPDLPAWASLAQPRGASVAAWAAGVALLVVAKNALLAAAAYAQSRVAGEATAELATRALAAYLDAPYSFHVEQGSAALTRKLTYSVEQAGRVVFQAATALVSELLVTAGIVAVLLAAAPAVTLSALVGLGVPCALLVRWTRRAFARWGEAERAHRQRVMAAVQHSLGGIKEVKAFDRERFFVSRFARDQSALADIHSRYDTLASAPRLIIETTLIGALLLATVALAGSRAAGADPVPLLGLFAYAAFRIIPSANRVLVHWGVLQFAAPAVEELTADLRAARPRTTPAAKAAPAPLVLRDRIAFEDVSFTYPGADAPVLDGVRLEVRRGEAVGIVGASGTGKTTLVSLLIGLFAPTGGRIRVDAIDLREQLRAWRAAVGYVPQDPFLLEDTVRRNIAFGEPDEAVDEARLRRALEAAQLDAFVDGLPGGLDTVIGERGARLSGGQRQRVAIARALYREPQVLLFDEATSALDVQTEAELARAVAALEGLTRIVVAQRLFTLRGCDRLVVLRDGAVEAAGTLDDLRERSETIRRMLSA